MAYYLSFKWDLGIAMGEFASSSILLFLAMIFSITVRRKLMPVIFGISTLFVIIIGWSIGSEIEGKGHGLSLITPISAILMSFHWNSFNALWFIILFQILGSIFGFIWFYLFKKFLLKKDQIVKEKDQKFSTKTSITKSLIFQPLLIITLLYVPIINGASYQTGHLLNAITTSLFIGLILFLTKDFGFIVFSPWISLAAMFSNGSNIKKNQIKTLLIDIIIQVLVMLVIITIDIYIFRGV